MYIQNIPSLLSMTIKSLPSFDGCRVLAEHLNIKELDPNNRRFSFNKNMVKMKTIRNTAHSNKKTSNWRLIKISLNLYLDLKLSYV